jgi:protein-arginine kinase activator protein McsA
MNHDRKLFHVCETCGFKFGKKDYYDNHVKFIHPIPQEDTEEEEEEHEEEEEELSNVPATEEDSQLKEKLGIANCVDLSNSQLLTILKQNRGRRVTIVGPDGRVKYLSVAPKQEPLSTPQVNMSQIFTFFS